MILDARDDSVSLNLESCFAIVGAGPAGITLARKLAHFGTVVLVESGGLDPDPNVQALYEGESIGIKYAVRDSRARQFGGSSNLWAGYCAIFDRHDFTKRPWVPRSGWPFDEKAINPYYQETAELLNLGEPDFDAANISAQVGLCLPFDPASIVPTVWRFSNPLQEFGKHFREELGSSPSITTLLHTNVMDIRLSRDHSTVAHLPIATLTGRKGRIVANFFVLACGGIETARILLNANSQIPQGIGNVSGLVGRFFIEHPHVTVKSVTLADADWFGASLERQAYHQDRKFMLAIGLRPELQETAAILNARAHIFRRDAGENIPMLGIMFEQAPNPDSRIELSNNSDALGLQRARLRWELTGLDRKSHELTAQLVTGEIERLKAGRRNSHGEALSEVEYCNHHIGTTRMSDDPSQGVVNPDCRFHDLINLYIAGSSVFPTGSWANPTFTALALTLRLADHLRSQTHA